MTLVRWTLAALLVLAALITASLTAAPGTWLETVQWAREFRKTDDTMVRVPPYLEDLGELRSMIDDTVGPPPAAQSLRRQKK